MHMHSSFLTRFTKCLNLYFVQSSQLGCSCAHSTCFSATCDHVYLFDNDYDDAKDIYGKPMNGRFPYDERGRIILEVSNSFFLASHIFPFVQFGCSRAFSL